MIRMINVPILSVVATYILSSLAQYPLPFGMYNGYGMPNGLNRSFADKTIFRYLDGKLYIYI